MPEIVDLDAARIERATKRNGEHPQVKFMDVVYDLPDELPIDFSIKVGQLREHPEYLQECGQMMFGDQWESIRPKFTSEDAAHLLQSFDKLYGGKQGESQASAEG